MNLFTYHPPQDGDQERYVAIREAGLAFARTLVEQTPPSADQTAALRKVREAVFTANAAIACRDRGAE